MLTRQNAQALEIALQVDYLGTLASNLEWCTILLSELSKTTDEFESLSLGREPLSADSVVYLLNQLNDFVVLCDTAFQKTSAIPQSAMFETRAHTFLALIKI